MTSQAFPLIFTYQSIPKIKAREKTQTRRILSCANTTIDGKPWGEAARRYGFNGAQELWEVLDLNSAARAGNAITVKWRSDTLESFTHLIAPKHGPGALNWTREGVRIDPKAKRARFLDGTDLAEQFTPDVLVPWIEARILARRRVSTRRGAFIVPSIHVPRSLSQLTNRIRRSWIERVRDISEADSSAEGVTERAYPGASAGAPGRKWISDRRAKLSGGFGALWCHLHGWPSWLRNDWVIAYDFEAFEINVDRFRPATADAA